MPIFTTEEEVQLWVDDRDRVALERLVDGRQLLPQSEAVARQWLQEHPSTTDRRVPPGRRPYGAPPGDNLRRRSADQPRLWDIRRPLFGLVALVLYILFTGSHWRQQDVVSPIDGRVQGRAAVWEPVDR